MLSWMPTGGILISAHGSGYYCINPRAAHSLRSRCWGWLLQYFEGHQHSHGGGCFLNFGTNESSYLAAITPASAPLLHGSDRDIPLFACGRLMRCWCTEELRWAWRKVCIIAKNVSFTECADTSERKVKCVFYAVLYVESSWGQV